MHIASSMHQQILSNLEIRKAIFERCVLGNESTSAKVLLVGDRPGPSAPAVPDYHHTPFYSTRHCSGWLNASLYIEMIDESDLIWINSSDVDGNPTDIRILDRLDVPNIIALGGNAERWLKGRTFTKTYHPQYWKRFRTKERYPLLDMLHDFTQMTPCA